MVFPSRIANVLGLHKDEPALRINIVQLMTVDMENKL